MNASEDIHEKIRELGLLKIGIFGLMTGSASEYPAAREGITLSGEIETSQRMVKALHPNADIIIALSHSGDTVDEQIASTIPGVDIIIGGHSHSRMPIGHIYYHSDKLKAQEVNGTIAVQAGQWGGELGRLDLLFQRDEGGIWHIERYRALLIPAAADIPEDKAVAAVVDRYWKPIAAYHGEVMGQAAADFIERGDDLAPYSLVADAIRETFGTEIELENMGGVRAPLVKGKITREDLVDIDPFDNTIVTFSIRGNRLKQVLQTERPAVSGIRYRIENGVVAEATVAGKAIKNERMYTGATNSYFARTALKGIQVKNSGKQRLDVLIEYVRKKGTVRSVFDGRRDLPSGRLPAVYLETIASMSSASPAFGFSTMRPISLSPL